MLRVLSIFFYFIFIVSSPYAENAPCIDHQCIAVIDAGSTGSRVHIYSYDRDKTNTPTNISEVWNNKIKPGFASIDPNPATINNYLDKLLSKAPVQNIPIYFYATAGMRLQAQNKQAQYFEALNAWFSNHDQWNLKKAQTITGNDEGLYDWLAVNYHLGTLQSPEDKTIGVMDMGGASVQIVFPIDKNPNINKNSQVELSLYGKHFNLFVHSFLGLGQTEVSHQFLNSSACFSDEYQLPDGESGEGSARSCEAKVTSLINKVHNVNELIAPLLADNPVDSWYAIGGLSYLADSPLFHFEESKLSAQSLLNQGDSAVCHKQWDALNNQYPNDEFLYEYCLFSSYYYALIVDGYGLNPEQSIHYIPAREEIDWTLGVVLHQ